MKQKRLPLRQLPFSVSLLLTLPLAALETLLALGIQPGDFGAQWAYWMQQPLLLLLNYLPFWLLTLAGAFLLRDGFYGAALAGGVGLILSLVNRTMIEKRDEPFSPKDFALIKEAGDAVGSYGLSIHIPSLLTVILFIVLMVVLGKLFHAKRPMASRRSSWIMALSGTAVAVGVFISLIFGVYSSKELFNSFPVKPRFYMTGIYNSLGFPYCFCYHLNAYQVDRPEGFQSGVAAGYAAEYPEAPGGDPVNVIFVMNEAFSDITDQPMFDYPQGEEPLAFLHSLKGSDRALSGHIVVPNFGGGTANTEFDVLTGMQTNFIGESGASAFRVVAHETESLFTVFGKEGYATQFIHPGQAWFYNRQNVYRYMGAGESLFFEDAFQGAATKGPWVTDEAVGDVIIREFEEAVTRGDPYFCYTTTIQNHMAYTHDKYGEGHVSPTAPLKEGVTVEPGSHTMLSVYAEGVRDADAMLRDLVTYFDARQEPVVLVFFGDHLPNLGDNYQCYRQLGIEVGEGSDPATKLFTFSTPYVIWVNAAADREIHLTQRAREIGLPEDGRISANFLGATVLELTGREKADSFFQYLCELRREIPVYQKGTAVVGNTLYAELPEELEESIRKLRWWEYYKLKVE